jgi:hypothetical protein
MDRQLPTPPERRDVFELSEELRLEIGGHPRQEDWADWRQRLVRFLHANEGAMITGPGGTGKTALISDFKAYVQAQGEICHVLAVTHVAARLAGGETIERFVRK